MVMLFLPSTYTYILQLSQMYLSTSLTLYNTMHGHRFVYITIRYPVLEYVYIMVDVIVAHCISSIDLYNIIYLDVNYILCVEFSLLHIHYLQAACYIFQHYIMYTLFLTLKAIILLNIDDLDT